MNLTKRSALAVLALSFAVACGSKPAANKTETAAPAAQVGAAAVQIGVPECDEYLTKYTACIQSKVPASVRGTFEQSMNQARDAWKQAASSPEGKAALAEGCKQALDAAKQSTASFGCQW
jgi:hypothetical protein